MPKLTLKFKENTVSQYDLAPGKSITIGRMDKNDVVIENLAVSGYHAKIDAVDDRFLIVDLKSKNGVFVNEKLVSSHWLQNGDRITIGKHDLIFSYEEGEAQPETDRNNADMDQTMVMDTDAYQDMLAKSAHDLKGTQPEGGMSIGILSYLAGGEGEVELKKKLSKIGKDPSSDIVVSGLTVGKTAATISKRPNGYHLAYVGGMSKPRVNGETIKESVQLNEFDVIEIGGVKLQLVFKN